MVLATLLVGAVVVENWRGERAWQAYRAQRTAAGDPVDVFPAPSSVPPERNFMKTPVLDRLLYVRAETSDEARNFVARAPGALIGLPPDDQWWDGVPFSCEEFFKWQKDGGSVGGVPLPDRRRRANNAGPDAPITAADVLATLGLVEAELSELRHAARTRDSSQLVRPKQLESDTAHDGPVPSFALVRAVQSALVSHACASLLEKRTGEACDDATAALRCARGFLDMPDAALIETMIGHVLVRLAVYPVWEGIERHAWSDAELARLQQELDRAVPLDSLRRCLKVERAIGFSFRPETGARLLVESVDADSRPWWFSGYRVLPSWVKQNNVRFGQGIEAIREAIGTGRPWSVFGALPPEEDIKEVRRSSGPYDFFARDSLRGLSRSLSRSIRIQAIVVMARTACALERHRLASGVYPESLDGVVPSLLAAVPIDPVDGQAIRYRRNADGTFLLYSIGIDGKDDDGRAARWAHEGRNAGRDGDWIWPRLKE